MNDLNQIPVIEPQTPMPQKKRHPIVDLLAALLYPLLMFACQYAAVFGAMVVVTVSAVVNAVGEAEVEDYVTTWVNGHLNEILIVADLMILLILFVWFVARRKSLPKVLMMNRVKPATLVWSALAGLGLTCALNYVMIIVEVLFPAAMEEYSEHMGETGGPIAFILAGIILAPIVEELLFRALSLSHFDRVLPRWLSILLVSGLFGLVHGNLVQGLYAGALGAVLGCLFFAYDSILPPIALHFGFNLFSVVALVDTTKMSTMQETLFVLAYHAFSVAAAIVGAIAIYKLAANRTHPFWSKPKVDDTVIADTAQ